MATYQGKKVASRPAKQGDQGFDQSKGEQVTITMPDGTEKTVAKNEVQEQDQGQGQGQRSQAE